MPSKASRKLEVIHQKQKQKKELNAAGVPQVGIFWIFPDRLLGFGVPNPEGEKYGDFLNTPEGHYETWGKQDTKIKKWIIEKFRLPVDQVEFKYDHHYEK